MTKKEKVVARVMARLERWIVVALWVLIALIAVTVVGCFVLSNPEAPLTLVLPSADAVAKATKELGDPKADPKADAAPLRTAATQVRTLEKGADPKNPDEFKKQVSDIARSIEDAANKEEARSTAVSEKVAKLDTASKALDEEVARVRTTLKSLQGEGTQWRANLITNLLWFLLLSALLVALFVIPNLTGMMRFAVRFIRGVKVPGFELSFAENAAENHEEIHLWFSEAFDELRGQARKALRLFVEQRAIEEEFQRSVRHILQHIRNKQNVSPLVQGATAPEGGAAVDSVRCTLHVRDVVFQDYLCQLLDYYPRRSAGGRAGRAWPVCYGMIGRVWRSERSELRSLSPPGTQSSVNQTLIDEYAMTEEQVKELVGNGRSFLCLLLRNENGSPLGVLYMDAPDAKVFGESSGAGGPYSAVREDVNDFIEPLKHCASASSWGGSVSSPLSNDFTELLAHCSGLVKKLSLYTETVYGKAPLIEVTEAR